MQQFQMMDASKENFNFIPFRSQEAEE
jgi:hypothetical protein